MAENTPYVDPRYNDKADVFSFGVMMFEIFSRTMLLRTHGRGDPCELIAKTTVASNLKSFVPSQPNSLPWWHKAFVSSARIEWIKRFSILSPGAGSKIRTRGPRCQVRSLALNNLYLPSTPRFHPLHQTSLPVSKS